MQKEILKKEDWKNSNNNYVCSRPQGSMYLQKEILKKEDWKTRLNYTCDFPFFFRPCKKKSSKKRIERRDTKRIFQGLHRLSAGLAKRNPQKRGLKVNFAIIGWIVKRNQSTLQKEILKKEDWKKKGVGECAQAYNGAARYLQKEILKKEDWKLLNNMDCLRRFQRLNHLQKEILKKEDWKKV